MENPLCLQMKNLMLWTGSPGKTAQFLQVKIRNKRHRQCTGQEGGTGTGTVGDVIR